LYFTLERLGGADVIGPIPKMDKCCEAVSRLSDVGHFNAIGSNVYFVTANKLPDQPPITSDLWVTDGTANNTIKAGSLTTN